MKRKKDEGRPRSIEPYLFVAPTVIIFVFVLAIPLVNLVRYSLGESNIIQGYREWNNFENFLYLISPDFLASLAVTLKYVVFSVIGIAFFGMAVSLALNMPIFGRGLFRAIAVVPWVIPHAFAATMWRWVVNPQFGFINQLLMAIGVIDEGFSFLNVDTALWTCVVVRIWQGTPFMIISLLAALQTIPEDIVEASLIDGATPFQQFFHITLPSIRNVFLTTILIITAWTIQIFDTVYIMTGGGPIRATQLVAIEVYQQAFQYDNLGVASAISLLILLIIVMLSLANQRGKEK